MLQKAKPERLPRNPEITAKNAADDHAVELPVVTPDTMEFHMKKTARMKPQTTPIPM
jgi:hypothetical protein